MEAAAFIAPNASVIGEVNVGSGSSVWYGATFRGRSTKRVGKKMILIRYNVSVSDINHITIGNHTNVLDAAIIHVAKIHRDIPTIIGNHVTIGPSSIIHACTIGSNCIIGTGTQILDGSVVESESIVAAGSIVTYGKVISSGQLWSGVPARYVRDLTTEEKAFIKQSAIEYAELSLIHAKECEKSLEEIVAANERSKILEEIGKFGLPEKEKAQQEMGMFFRY